MITTRSETKKLRSFNWCAKGSSLGLKRPKKSEMSVDATESLEKYKLL
jgi:hypothetical protein